MIFLEQGRSTYGLQATMRPAAKYGPGSQYHLFTSGLSPRISQSAGFLEKDGSDTD